MGEYMKGNIVYACPECKSTKLKEDKIHGETYCARCGLVLIAPPVHGLVFPGLKLIIIDGV